MGLEKCIKQPALTAVRNVKFLSNQRKADQFIAEIATRNTDHNSKIVIGN